jgi:hypothetical protein
MRRKAIMKKIKHAFHHEEIWMKQRSRSSAMVAGGGQKYFVFSSVSCTKETYKQN